MLASPVIWLFNEEIDQWRSYADEAATALANTLLLESVSDEMHGRIMAFYMDATQGASYLGALPVGILAQMAGSSLAVDLSAIVSLLLVGTSSIMGAVNYITTIVKCRAPGMTFDRMPLTVWSIFITSILVLFGTPVLTSALILLLLDRHVGTTFFTHDGQPLLELGPPRARGEADVGESIRLGETLGSPIAMVVWNRDAENWATAMSPLPPEGEVNPKALRAMYLPRPGHADLVGVLKYDRRDTRDILERASARETTMRVACGAVCKRLLAEVGVRVDSHIVSIGDVTACVPERLPEDALKP